MARRLGDRIPKKLQQARLRAPASPGRTAAAALSLRHRTQWPVCELLIEVVVRNARPDGCPIMRQMQSEESNARKTKVHRPSVPRLQALSVNWSNHNCSIIGWPLINVTCRDGQTFEFHHKQRPQAQCLVSGRAPLTVSRCTH